MRFSDDGTTWSAYESLTASKSYTLPTGTDGHRTVRVQFIDKANNRSLTYSDYILLDRTLPTGSIIINKGDATTTTRSVTLGLTWADSGSLVSRMRFSDDGAHWTAWEPQKATKAYTLPEGLENHTVRVQFLDGAGNYSATYNDYIKLVAATATEETIMLPGSVPLVMKSIPAGIFTMGSPNTEDGRYADESPQHSVTLGAFWMGKYQVTKRQWIAVMGTTPWTDYTQVSSDLDSPAVGVSWVSIQSFVTALNALTGKTFHLPSESQSEYASRAGTTTRYYWGDDPNWILIGDYAWWYNNTYGVNEIYAHKVGQKLPNAFGLYDMCGNVLEYCQDYYHDSYTGAPTDGSAWMSPTATFHVLHGGCFAGDWTYERSAHRSYDIGGHYFYGFRVAK
jgi:formylglycine-generating enzyme required for sulfatase activity